MKKIDTTSWRQFCIEDLFDVVKGKRLTKADRIEGDINYIGASIFDNGITAKIGNSEYLHPAGTITVCYNCSDIGTAFYQEEPFWATDDVNVLYPKFEMSPHIAHFICPIIHRIGQKYTYDNKWTAEKMRKTIIFLPAYHEDPDWQYMEEYMRQIKQRIQCSISTLINTKNARLKIDHSYWKEFPLYSDYLFDIDMGSKLDRAKMTKINPTINFVGRGSINNGVVDVVDVINGIVPYPAGCISLSLGGSIGASFIQDKPFYTSQNVCVLKPKHNMPYYCKEFIVTMIKNEGQRRYKAFSDELNRHIRTDFKIKLPATPSGDPDWHYMEMYMRGVEAIVKNKLSLLVPHKSEVAIKDAANVTFNNAKVTYIDQSKTYNVK